MIAARTFLPLAFVALSIAAPALPAQQLFNDDPADRSLRHESPEWLTVAPHLPDTATATPAALEVAGDVLRARRLPEDALDFYRAALVRGGDEPKMLNRIGITLLELHQHNQARTCFQRAVKLRPKDADGWNNLGASEYVAGSYQAAIRDYQRAVKLNKRAATFRSNLGTAYFEVKDYESAQKEFDVALSLDPGVFVKGGMGGVQAHVLSPEDRGRYCFEMARVSARHHDDNGVMMWLGKAIETGYDIRFNISQDSAFDLYHNDPRVVLLVKNAKAMRAGLVADAGPAPALPADANSH